MVPRFARLAFAVLFVGGAYCGPTIRLLQAQPGQFRGPSVCNNNPADPGAEPAVTCVSGAASASTAPMPAAVQYERVWYGDQILGADIIPLALTIGFGVYIASRKNTEQSARIGTVFASGMIITGLGAPIVHWANRQASKGFASCGIRIVLPAVGIYFYLKKQAPQPREQLFSNAANDTTDAKQTQALVGTVMLLSAIPVATLVDSVFLAYKEQPKVHANFSFSPTLSPHDGGVLVGIVGAFLATKNRTFRTSLGLLLKI